jgi:hypothetical protein
MNEGRIVPYARLVEHAWGTARGGLHLRPRRFRCRQVPCPRRIFCERLPQVGDVYGRQTRCVREARQRIGFALGAGPVPGSRRACGWAPAA